MYTVKYVSSLALGEYTRLPSCLSVLSYESFRLVYLAESDSYNSLQTYFGMYNHRFDDRDYTYMEWLNVPHSELNRFLESKPQFGKRKVVELCLLPE